MHNPDIGCIYCKQDGPFELISSKVRDSEKHSIHKCQKCKLVQIYPMPTVKEDIIFYNENTQQLNVEGIIDLKTKRIKSLKDTIRRVELIESLTSKNNMVLDIGCGYGFVIESLIKKGYNAYGLEPSKARASTIRKYLELPILTIDPISPVPINHHCYDIITLFQVLEHITRPVEFLKWLSNFKKKGTILIIEVPNLENYLMSFCEPYQNFYWQRAHVAYYCLKTLNEVLFKSGWIIKDIKFIQRYNILNMMHWLFMQKPRLDEHTYKLPKELTWLDRMYQEEVIQNDKADTLLVIASHTYNGN